MTKTKLIFFLALQSVFVRITLAQEKKPTLKSIGIEGGIDMFYSELINGDNIRGDVPSYNNAGEATKNLSILFYKTYFGLKTEIYTLSNKFSFSGGLRFTRMVGSVGKDTYWGTTSNFFYFLYRQEGNNTEFLKIKEITQSSDYIGIPLEASFFPMKLHRVQLYFKTGIEFNYRLQTRTNIKFYDDTMNSFSGDVKDMFGQPHSFCSLLYGGVGIRYGKPSKPNLNMEVYLPTIFLSKEVSGLVNPMSGGGVKFIVQIPIKAKAQ